MNGHHGVRLWGGLARRQALLLPSRGTSSLLTRALSSRRGADTASSHDAASNVAAIQSTPHLKRKLGQHLLVTERILTDIVDAAQLPQVLQRKEREAAAAAASAQVDSDADAGSPAPPPIVRVLEIGPGTGNLTSALLRIAPNLHVHAVEYDARMVERLNERFRDELTVTRQLRLENIDFEKFAFAKHLPESDPAASKRRVSIRGRAKARERATAAAAAAAENESRHFDACVANIPYQLSSIIISRLTNYMFRFPDRLQCAVLLVQEEFAQRLLAKPGTQNYSRLSVNTALIADVESVVRVGREHFLPPPKVDSRVIKLTPKRRDVGAEGDDDQAARLLPDSADKDRFFQRFDTLLRIAFTRKNKTLRAALLSSTAKSLMEPAALDALSKDELTSRVEEALETTGLASKRAVQLPVEDFKRLMDALAARDVVFRVSKTRHFRD